MKSPLQVLLVEDSDDDAQLLIRELTRGGYQVSAKRVETAEALHSALAEEGWQVVLCDFTLPHFNGTEALRIVKKSALDIPFIYVSGTIGEDIAVEAMKAGAHDYVVKHSLARLVPAIERELREAQVRRQGREAETQMRMSEHKYRHLFRSMRDAALLIAEETDKIIDANEQAEVLLGRSRKELLGMNHTQLYPSPGPTAALAGDSPLGCETEIRRNDGQIVPVDVCSSRIELYERPFKLTLFRDITERKRAEEALTLFRALIDQANDAIEVIDPETVRFLDVNEKACQSLGYSRTEFLSLNVPDVEARLNFSTPDLWRQHVEAIRSQGSRIMEGEHRRKDGSVFPVEINSSYVRLDRAYLVSVVRDITERKRAEKALHESEQRFRQVTENIDEVFWLADATDHRMIYVSPVYERIWGRPCSEPQTNPQAWFNAIHADDRQHVRETMTHGAAAGGYDLEYRIVRPDGSVRWIHSRAFPVLDANGQVGRLAGVTTDVTVPRQLEDQFRQAQKMEAIGHLAGGIAHDFNNLLGVIQLQSSMLLHQPSTAQRTQEGIQQILTASERAANLTRQLLTFSRRSVRQSKNIDLGQLVGDMTKLLRRLLGEDIALETRFAPALPLINADPGMMEQVIMNLAVNARDAMPEGGRLLVMLDAETIDNDYVRLHPRATPGAYICMSVSDTGCGISEENLPRIFEPFFTTKEIGKGTGLGLATVFGIIEQHHGWIEVLSTVGKGSTFNVFLPALPQSRQASPTAVVEKPVLKGGTETILLVEDEEVLGEITRTVLERCGYRVLFARSAAEAIALWEAQTTPVDLLLTDFIMPGSMTGWQLSETLTRRQPGLKVIHISGNSNDLLRERHHLLQTINFIAKPCLASELLATVRQCLDEPETVRCPIAQPSKSPTMVP